MTDHGKKSSIGGLALDFYHRIGKEYHYDGPAWRFEPKISLKVFNEMIKEQGITVIYDERIDLDKRVIKKGNKITPLRWNQEKLLKERFSLMPHMKVI